MTGTVPLPPARAAARDGALALLLSRELHPIVDMVGWPVGEGRSEVAAADGSVRLPRHPDGSSCAGAGSGCATRATASGT